VTRCIGGPSSRAPHFVAILVLASCTESSNVTYEVPAPPAAAPLAAEVNPFIGTAGDGQTFPGAVVPWGMASPSPHTTLTTAVDALEGIFVNSGYRYGEPTIRGFGLTHLSGVGCPELGLPVIAPTSGDPPSAFDNYASTYRNEVAHAGYYAVELGDRGMIAEMTATPRTGVFRFWLPEGEPANIVLDPARGVSWARNQAEFPDALTTREIAGSARFGLFCAMSGGGRLYFVARLDHPADAVGLFDPNDVPGEAMALWGYDEAPAEPVTLWVGLSWVSIEEARANLDAEQLPFDDARDAAAVAWQQSLGRIEVSGGSEADRTRFYTALYHALIHPSVLHDVRGTYPRFSRSDVGRAEDGGRYTVFSLWDTYRTLHPLLTLVYPETQLEILRSMQDMVLGAGAPPKWELVADEVQMMVGDPAAIVFADSYAKGLTDFDASAVYGVLRDAADSTEHRPGNADYLDLGFVPMEEADSVWGPVSTTLEYALADWSLAELARALGRNEDVDALLERASSYAGFYDGETGTLRPKNRDGSFLEPFDPDAIEGSLPLRLGGPGYVEGTAWHYAFFVPHDTEGLIALHGEQEFVERLQWVFKTGRFAMWNEPDMSYPYLFTFIEGEAHRTQREIRTAMDGYFGTGSDGLPGNDDAGTLSAWFVFSAMGFYPVTPGLPEYRLGSPLFERITIHLSEAHHDGSTFVIEALDNTTENIFVGEASLGGQPLSAPVLSHEAITSGGLLRLQMSALPN
jgi:predicted alpha-1,2-mannosidase